MKKWYQRLAWCGAWLSALSFCAAENWNQYRGNAGDGLSTESSPRPWPANGPKRLWTAATPAGFSSFVVADGKAFTIVAREVDGALAEVCLALDAQNGKELWATPTGHAKYRGGGDSGAEGNTGGDGPRSTPAVSDNKVYVYSAQLVLSCLDAQTGKVLWQKDILRDFGGKNIGWESAMSPVTDGKLVYIAGGGAGQGMLAFDKQSGAVAWKNGDEQMTHATPVIATLGGVRQVIYLMQSGLVSLDVANGKILWRFPFTYRTATGCSPVVDGNIVFCTAGYGVGGAACEVTKVGNSFEAKELWRIKGDNSVASLWSTPVCKDGYLYGMISFKKFGNGPLKCIDLKTGQVKWEQPGFGAGNVVAVGNDLVALADDGELVLVEARPDGYKELARTKAVTGKCWSTPALSNGRLYVRSTKESACLDLGSN
ncbi:MAG TPA: PQQ-binding-like beta-propeller repeat protein [Verrucomicrobiae bacterium]|nr:PQQ-binding-like beta-propeller repeat protein [Verrucomicrobiae bacterium]